MVNRIDVAMFKMNEIDVGPKIGGAGHNLPGFIKYGKLAFRKTLDMGRIMLGGDYLLVGQRGKTGALNSFELLSQIGRTVYDLKCVQYDVAPLRSLHIYVINEGPAIKPKVGLVEHRKS